MRILHLDCSAGVSGDMLLGALIDLGVKPAVISAELRKLNLPKWSWTVRRVRRGEFHGLRVDVKARGNRHGLIDAVLRQAPRAGLPAGVGDRGVRILRRILAAEAAVHGKRQIEHVHLHELEDLDTIVDVFGSVIALHRLGVERVFVGPVATGSGTVRAAHGVLPVPAPGTAELLVGQRIQLGTGVGEQATPTGAALVAELAEAGPPPPMTLLRIGSGAGMRDTPSRANLLRAMLGETNSAIGSFTGVLTEEICQLEAMVDDMSPQLVEAFLDRAYDEGALEAWVSPVSGKRGRPGICLTALCRPPRLEAVIQAFLEETGTLGLRVTRTERVSLPRTMGSANTRFGRIRVKYAGRGAAAHAIPEWRDVQAAAIRAGVPARIVLDEARKNSINAELTTKRTRKRQR